VIGLARPVRQIIAEIAHRRHAVAAVFMSQPRSSPATLTADNLQDQRGKGDCPCIRAFR
jgi:hypothetical protein